MGNNPKIRIKIHTIANSFLENLLQVYPKWVVTILFIKKNYTMYSANSTGIYKWWNQIWHYFAYVISMFIISHNLLQICVMRFNNYTILSSNISKLSISPEISSKQLLFDVYAILYHTIYIHTHVFQCFVILCIVVVWVGIHSLSR